MEFVFGDHRLDVDRRELWRGAEPIALEPQVFDLLVYLVRYRDRVVSKNDLLAAVWGGRIVSESTLTSRISAVRKAVGDSGEAQRLIRTMPRKGLRFVGPVREEEAPATPVGVPPTVQGPSERPINSVPRLSIVVLPSANLSSDPDQEYFADGITDDLTTDLSWISESFVIARSTAFTYKSKPIDVKQISRELGVRYALEGSVRRAGDHVRVNVQLIDAENGSHLWADRFDTVRADLAETQNEITGRLARTLNLELVKTVSRRIEQQNAVDPDARDLVMRGWAMRYQPISAATRQEALRAFERALEIDPRSIDARIGIASTLVANLMDGWSGSFQQVEARAEELLLEALERDADRPMAHYGMALLRRIQNRLTEAQIELETVIALDRNNAYAYRQLGMTLMYLGQPEAAIPQVEKSIRLSPRERGVYSAYYILGICYFFLGSVDQAVDLLRRARAANPRAYYVHLVLSGALGFRGDLDEARAAIAEGIALKPDVNSLARWRAAQPWITNPQHWALRDKTLNFGLRRAGFPDE